MYVDVSMSKDAGGGDSEDLVIEEFRQTERRGEGGNNWRGRTGVENEGADICGGFIMAGRIDLENVRREWRAEKFGG